MDVMSLQKLEKLFDHSPVMLWLSYIGLFMLGITLLEMLVDLVLDKAGNSGRAGQRLGATDALSSSASKRSGPKRDWKDSGANFLIGLFKELMDATVFGIVLVVMLYLVSFLVLAAIPMNIWSWLAAVVLADLTYYWMHRFEHEIRILWAHHSVHHSSNSYNLTTGFRLSVMESAVEWIFFIPMILMGFGVFQTVASLMIVALYQHWIHTEKIGRLGWLDRWFNTPSTHRVHHGVNAHYLDKNYGGILMLWDHLFGTYEPEGEPVLYGLVEPMQSYNILTINFAEYIKIWGDVCQCRSWADRLRIIFGVTSWRPAYFAEQKARIEVVQ